MNEAKPKQVGLEAKPGKGGYSNEPIRHDWPQGISPVASYALKCPSCGHGNMWLWGWAVPIFCSQCGKPLNEDAQ